MGSEPPLRPSTSPVSVAKRLPRLSSVFPLRDDHDAATLKLPPAPGSLRDNRHASCAWFLGPKAENADYFKVSVETILNDVIQCRRSFSPEDEVCIRLLGDSRRPYPDLVGFHRRRSYLLVCVQEEYVKTENHSNTTFWATPSALRSFLFSPLYGAHGVRCFYACYPRIPYGTHVQSKQCQCRGRTYNPCH